METVKSHNQKLSVWLPHIASFFVTLWLKLWSSGKRRSADTQSLQTHALPLSHFCFCMNEHLRVQLSASGVCCWGGRAVKIKASGRAWGWVCCVCLAHSHPHCRTPWNMWWGWSPPNTHPCPYHTSPHSPSNCPFDPDLPHLHPSNVLLFFSPPPTSLSRTFSPLATSVGSHSGLQPRAPTGCGANRASS